MKHLLIIGSQWGDEGKGKIVDFLARKYDVVVKFTGGNNAGHTVVIKNKIYKMHIIPSGVFQGKKALVAPGVVFDPEVLLTEMDTLRKNNIPLDLLIDWRVNLVMPYHRELDAATEIFKGKSSTGSLRLGIGYCYEDKNNRSGIRCEDIINPKLLREKLGKIIPIKKSIIEKVYGQKSNLNIDEIFKLYIKYGKILNKYFGDVSEYITSNLTKKKFMFEGANGTMLDGTFGTVPYTVANQTIAGTVFAHCGIPIFPMECLGIVKSYTTRVGNGPFPTEQTNTIGEHLQTIGQEFGATSGRKRRCGWLDLPLVRYAKRLNGFNNIAVTKLDVLTGLPEIKIATHYLLGGKKIYEFPARMSDLPLCRPEYRIFKGWQKDIGKIKDYLSLPEEVKNYLAFIEKRLDVPIKYISCGAEREAIIAK
jgi:adenylosuccinate synthase